MGRQRDGAGNPGTGTLGGLDDVLGGLIDDAIIEALELDADALAFHAEKERV